MPLPVLIPRPVLFGNPDRLGPTLSPDGAWVTGADVYLLLGSVEPLSRAIDGSWPSLRKLLPGQSTSSTS